LPEVDGLCWDAIEALPAAIYMTDAEGRITFYNEAAAKLWGCRPELGESKFCGSWKLYWPDGTPLSHDECPMAMALRQKRPIHGKEAVAERPDGTRIHFIPYPTPLFDPTGSLTGAVNMLVDISERRRAEQDNQRLAAIVEASEDAIISKDLSGIVTSWNPGAERLLGYAKGEAIGKSITLVIPPHLRDEEASIIDQIARGERIEHFETTRLRKDGTLVSVSLSISPVRNGRGAVIGASTIVRDITERLAQRNTQLELASKAGRVGSFVIDYSTGHVNLSPGCAVLLGLPESIVKMSRDSIRKRVFPEDLAQFDALRDHAFLKKQREIFAQFRIIRADDGEVRWIEARSLIHYDQSGQPQRLMAAIIDFTERKMAADMLAERSLQLELAGKSGLVGTYAYDIGHGDEVAKISAGYAAIHGLPEGTAEVTRSVWLASMHPEDVGRLHVLRSQVFQNRQREYQVDYRIFRAGEIRWIESRRFISYNGDGCALRVIGVDIDITERKRAEERQRVLVAELDHRVKNALATVSAVVSQTLDASSSMADFATALDGRLRSMARTHDLLSASRWQGISVAELVRRELAPYATTENAEINGPEVSLRAEAGQVMAMVLHELVTNAAKYGALSTSTGQVCVRWHLRRNGQSPPYLVLEWQESGGPPVARTGKPSYGTSTICDLIPYEFRGSVDLVNAPDGVRCHIELPGDWLSNHGEPVTRSPTRANGQQIDALPTSFGVHGHETRPFIKKMSDHTETEHVPLARPTAPNPEYWAHIRSVLRAVDSHIVEGENRRFKHGKLMEKLEDTSDVILAHQLQLNLETGLRVMRLTRARLLKELQKAEISEQLARS
jgi:PAS domain S-box-containing protein